MAANFSRKSLDQNWGQLDSAYKLIEPEFRMLSDYFQPRRGRFLQGASEQNQTQRRTNRLIDHTPRQASNRLSAGFLAGVTSPARPWFKLKHPNPEFKQSGPVAEWMESTTRRMREVMSQTNLYQVLQMMYGEAGSFGTAAMAVLEDDESVFRCQPFTVGQYRIAQNHRYQVDTFYYETTMTPYQMASQFGLENMSRQAKSAFENQKYNTYFTVRMGAFPNKNRDPEKIDNKNMPFTAVYWEPGTGEEDDKVLLHSGFREFPFLTTRWESNAEDEWGSDCPGMQVVGKAKALQIMHREKDKGIAKQVDPPLNVPAQLKKLGASVMPGAANYLNSMGGSETITPIYSVNPNVQGLLLNINDAREQINQAFFVDLFLMISQMDDHRMTATEVAQRQEEKLIMLGPVLERMQYELLGPLIDRIFSIMMKKGLIEEPPQELEGEVLQVEYVSILAQAQKAIGVNSIERFTSYVGGLAGIDPNVLNKVDTNHLVDEYGDAIGVTPRAILSDDEAAARAQQQQQQAQQAQAAEQAKTAADTAKTLSDTQTDDGQSLLNQLGLA